MVKIVADERLVRELEKVEGRVELADANGICVGFVTRPPSAEDIRIAKERLANNAPRFTTEEVIDHLKSLEPK
jgi:hypothetical protein